MYQQRDKALQWRHNRSDGVSNHEPRHCLLNRSFGHRSKKTSKLRVTGLCAGNSPLTGEFPAQKARNAENFSHLMTSSCDNKIWRSFYSGNIDKPWSLLVPVYTVQRLSTNKHRLYNHDIFFSLLKVDFNKLMKTSCDWNALCIAALWHFLCITRLLMLPVIWDAMSVIWRQCNKCVFMKLQPQLIQQDYIW